MHIVIIGAGIAGLSAALSLHEAGLSDIRVYERVPEIKPLGVGINLLPHAVRELSELGLGEQVKSIGIATSTLSYFNRHGQPIWSEPRGLAAGYHWPQYSVHRGEFQMLLLEAVRDRLGQDAVVLGQQLVHVERAPGSVTTHLASETGETTAVEADLLIAADGIHSRVRREQYPDEGKPIWNGLVLWRGTALAAPYLDGRTMIMAGDGLQKFVAYPLTSTTDDGLARINFIAEQRAPEGTSENADWNQTVDPKPIIELFADWKFDWLDVPGLIASSEQMLEYPMVDRDPLERWTDGRTTLIGDAAHPTYPIGSNGASQAIIDGRALAYELATSATIEDALEAYEAARRPATAALVRSNRKLGPERVLSLAYERSPEGFHHIHDVLSQDELEAIAGEYKRAAGFDPALLNDRASYTPGQPT